MFRLIFLLVEWLPKTVGGVSYMIWTFGEFTLSAYLLDFHLGYPFVFIFQVRFINLSSDVDQVCSGSRFSDGFQFNRDCPRVSDIL